MNNHRFRTTTDAHAAKDIAATKGPFILVFRAGFSGPCALFRDTLEEFYPDRENGLPVILADLEDCTKLAEQYHVKAVPFVCYFDKDGEHVRSAKGAMTLERLREFCFR